MRIAFVSCFSTRVFDDQPVWDWIAAQAPDHLVLLGDSLYLDVPLDGPHPRDMDDDSFAQHLFAQYTELLAQGQFKALVSGMPAGRVWSTWDDHDFLWNDALGAEARATPEHAGKVRVSTAFQEAFRRSLAASLAHRSFPAAYNDPVFWDPQQPPLDTPSMELQPGVWLHLADVRSWRTRTWLLKESKRHLLGLAQRQRLGAAMAARPAAVHVLASGSTLASYKRHYPQDWHWINEHAAARRTLVLSGDIHRNETDAFHTGGWPLHEATSSGAAVRDAVIIGQRRRNYGMLEFTAGQLHVRLYADNRLESKWSRVLDINTWLPV
jgi:alkaline phosphatase D